MNLKIIKSTTKGQVTLPNIWREKFNTDNYILEIYAEKLIIKPIDINKLKNEEIIFDAERDNDGKGVSPAEFIKILKRIK